MVAILVPFATQKVPIFWVFLLCVFHTVHICPVLFPGKQRPPCGPVSGGSDGLPEWIRINIPRYVLRGQGKDEHFEFEVKMSVREDTWTVFRRYSRFREMHQSLRCKYPQLAALEFPPKKLFGNKDERMVAERRNHLERYLRSLFRVMLTSSGSPLCAEADGTFHLSKHSVCELSPFFKKGVFECSRHGTS